MHVMSCDTEWDLHRLTFCNCACFSSSLLCCLIQVLMYLLARVFTSASDGHGY